MRAVKGVVLLAAGLGVASCGDAPPAGFEHARNNCADLRGQWIVGASDLAWLAPGRTPPAGDLPFLAIEADSGRGLDLVARRRRGDVLAEAATLQLTHPDRYRTWRARALGLPVPRPPVADDGARDPVVEWRWSLGVSACESGWRQAGMPAEVAARPGSPAVDHIGFLSMTRGDDGSLLLRRKVRRANDTGWTFFGQSVRWFSAAYTEFRKLSPAPPGSVPAPLQAADLPEAVSSVDRLASAYAGREALSRFEREFRRQLPPDVRVTIFRQRGMDPVALALPPGLLRVEIAGDWPIDGEDPFLPRLQADPRVRDIEVKQKRLQPDNRPYVLVEFTLDGRPAPAG